MRSLNEMIELARSKYKPEDGFRPPLVFEAEKTVISVEPGDYPNMYTATQTRLKSEGYRAFNLQGEEIKLFSPAKLELR